MKHPAAKQIKNIYNTIASGKETFKTLRKHLHKQPVGFPSTLTGVELKLLRAMFTADEAKAALYMDYKHRPLEEILSRANGSGIDAEEFSKRLASMESKGSIYVKYKEGKAYYALHPFILGMYEFQLSRITPEFGRNAYSFILQKYMIELLTTEVPQMRVVPVEKSLTPEHHIATYDQIRELVDAASDKLCVGECLCKKNQLIQGDPCKLTDRMEVCIGFRDWTDTYVRNGWARPISKSEALEILDQNEADGHVLQPSSLIEPQFVCSCCGCCCGALKAISSVPRPVDFAGSNFYADADPTSCNGCTLCVNRCQMDAVKYDYQAKKIISIDRKRCIGCGLCVPTCKTGALRLKEKQTPFIPPKDDEELYETIMQHKKGTMAKFYTYSKAMLGMKTNARE